MSLPKLNIVVADWVGTEVSVKVARFLSFSFLSALWSSYIFICQLPLIFIIIFRLSSRSRRRRRRCCRLSSSSSSSHIIYLVTRRCVAMRYKNMTIRSKLSPRPTSNRMNEWTRMRPMNEQMKFAQHSSAEENLCLAIFNVISVRRSLYVFPVFAGSLVAGYVDVPAALHLHYRSDGGVVVFILFTTGNRRSFLEQTARLK